MSFMRSRLFIIPILFFCFAVPFTANAFFPAVVGLALRFSPAAAKFLKAGIKAVKPARRISPTKIELSLSTVRGLENRVLLVAVGTGTTAAYALAAWLSYTPSSVGVTICSNWSYSATGAQSSDLGSLESLSESRASGYNFTGSGWVLNPSATSSNGGREVFSNLYTPNTTVPFIGNPFTDFVSCLAETVSAPASAIDNMLVDIELNPSQASTDNLVAGLKAMSDNDWDSIVEIMDTGAIQPTSDYFSGDTIAVNTLGKIVLNGVIQNAAAYIGKDGKWHTLTLDSNNNVLVDGQSSTGFTASNPSSGTSTPVVSSGLVTTTKTTDAATGVQTTQTSSTRTDSSGNSVVSTTTTTFDPSTGQSSTTTSSTTTTGTAQEAASAVSGNGISSSFDNFGLGVGKTVGDQFAPLTGGGSELCFTSSFAGTHCLSDFDKGGIWTGYVRTFFGFLGSLLAFMIPLYVALRL